MMSFVIKTNGTVLALYHWRLAVVFLVFFISFVKICSSSIIPPQNHGLNRDHDFGAKKMKARSRKTLGENICQLIIRGNILHFKVSTKYLLTNKMVIHLHMLCMSMKHRIGGNGKSRDIITPEFGRKGKKDAKILENLSKPTKLSSNGCKSSIF